MYSISDMRELMLFGSGPAAGAGSAPGESAGSDSSADKAVDAGRQRLLELGVPADKLNKRTAGTRPRTAGTTPRKESRSAPAVDKVAPTAAADSADGSKLKAASEATAPNAGTGKRMTWDEIKADPEYNKEIQAVIQARLKSAKGSEDTLKRLTPALEVLSRKYGLDPAKLDYDALAKAISDDSDYYESRALEMGVPVETAKRIDQQEREMARQKRAEEQTLERQRIAKHIQKLEREGESLKRMFPSFNLRRELSNPVFVRLTSPGVGLSVEDAYFAVHRREIQSASMQVAAKKVTEKLSNAIRSGTGRPQENGTSGKAPSVTNFDYKNASRDQREALKRRIRDAAARGEKLYPGG